eukprot:3937189-Rhodomonas_salina.1
MEGRRAVGRRSRRAHGNKRSVTLVRPLLCTCADVVCLAAASKGGYTSARCENTSFQLYTALSPQFFQRALAHASAFEQ